MGESAPDPDTLSADEARHLVRKLRQRSERLHQENQQLQDTILVLRRQLKGAEALHDAHDKREHESRAHAAELTRANAELRADEEHFRTVLRESPIVLFNHDLELRYTWIYNAHHPISVEYMIGKTDAELLPPNEAATMMRLKRSVLEHGSGTRTTVCTTPTGEPRWYDMKIEPLRDEQDSIVGLTCIASDITESYRTLAAQQLLSEVSKQLALALGPDTRLQLVAHLLVPDLADLCTIDIINDDGSIQPRTLVARDELQPVTLPSERPYFLSLNDEHPLARAIWHGETVWLPQLTDDHLQMAHHNPTNLDHLRQLGVISYIGVPLLVGRQTIGILSIFRAQGSAPYDEHDRNTAEEVARRAALAIDNARLYVAEQEARAQAETALQARDQMFRLVSHDLRGPLTTIQGYVHLLRKRLTKADLPDSERTVRSLDHIDNASRRMASLIQELLDVASLQAGKPLKLNWQPFDMVGLVCQVTEAVQAIGTAHEIHLETSEPELPSIGDEPRLDRVFTNLLQNAVKYSPEGGEVGVTIRRTMDGERPWAIVSIRDSGIGIPPGEIDSIFEPFRRASNTADGSISGTGLGLASARQIIEQHGGSIAVESQERAGSTFTVRLPLDSVDDVLPMRAE
jgi:PAS domain S-box-containing protein